MFTGDRIERTAERLKFLVQDSKRHYRSHYYGKFIVLSRFYRDVNHESTESCKRVLCRCIKRSINALVSVNAVSVLV